MIATPNTTVGDLAAQFPQTLRVFQRLRIELCCDGQRTLGDLCRERHLSFDDVATALAAVVAAPPRKRADWNTRPLSDLTAHIVEAFHEPLRQELPLLRAMAAKVQRHTDPDKHVLAVVLYELERFSADLELHLATTERKLFPLIGRLESGEGPGRDSVHFQHLRAALEAEHVEFRCALRILSNATHRFERPSHACATLHRLYRGLTELEQLMQLHVHLENNVLFPRAAALLSEARF